MINEFFKLMWNRKKTNFLTSLGLLAAFVSTFVACVVIVFLVSTYVKEMGFNDKDVWRVSTNWDDTEFDKKVEIMKIITNTLKSHPKINMVSLDESFIYQPIITSNTRVQYDDKKALSSILQADLDYKELLGIKVDEGRWFNENDFDGLRKPIIISRELADDLFTNINPLGRTMKRNAIKYEIIGIINNFRQRGALQAPAKFFILPISLQHPETVESVLSESFATSLLLKVKPGTTIEFEKELNRLLQNIAPTWTFNISQLSNLKKDALKTQIIIPGIILTFSLILIINVILGLFGNVWYHTHKRKSEIGLRRALGATKAQIRYQIIGETITLTMISVIFASIIILQLTRIITFDYLNWQIYLSGYALALLMIITIALTCALLPANYAASIMPSQALHEE
jgi:putative ABC transport system permease protein